VQVTEVIPVGNTDPDDGLHTTVGGGEQLSVASGVVYVTVSALVNGHVTFAVFVMPGGHPFEKTGGCVVNSQEVSGRIRFHDGITNPEISTPVGNRRPDEKLN